MSKKEISEKISSHSQSENKLAIVLIRGTVNVSPDVRKTLELLRLRKKHALVVVDDTPMNRGMAQRVKDYATYGVINEKFFAEIISKRVNKIGKADAKVDAAKVAKEYFSGKVKLREFEEKFNIKPFFRLAPPVGGFERKGIKMSFAKGGVLGNRADKINELIAKML